MKQSFRIPSLDGLRAISIALVVVAHLVQGQGLPFDGSRLAPLGLGQLGVSVFFVISGFLITGILASELEKTGTVSIRNFYYRRTLRIFPAYYAFLAAMAIASLFGFVHVGRAALMQATTYTSNYAVVTTGRSYLPEPLGNSWSLSVEEQFYLLWPSVLLLVGLARARNVVIALLLLSPVAMFAEVHIHALADGIGLTFETALFPIAAGSLLALVWPSLDQRPEFRWLMNRRWSIVLLAPFVFAPTIQASLEMMRHAWMLPQAIQACGLTLFLAWCVVNSTTIVGRALNARPLVYLGGLSYSLYLWQQPFLLGGRIARLFPLNVVLAFVCAVASHSLIEKPVLRWRDRHTARVSRSGYDDPLSVGSQLKRQ